MSWPVTNTTRIHDRGDSISQGTPAYPGPPWVNYSGSLRDQLLAAPGVSYPPLVPPPTGRATLGMAPGPFTPAAQTGRRDNLTIYGVGGQNTAQLMADIPSITTFAPDVFIPEIGTNDFSSAVPAATFGSNCASIMDSVHAALPNCKILWLSPPIRDERWTAGPHCFDGLDTWAGLTNLQTAIAARSSYVEYVDLITPALAWLVANNLANVTPFALTVDSTHPTQLGAQLMATAVMQHFAFS